MVYKCNRTLDEGVSGYNSKSTRSIVVDVKPGTYYITPEEDQYYNIPIELIKKADNQIEVVPQIAYNYNMDYLLHIDPYYIRSIEGSYLEGNIKFPFKLIGGDISVTFEDSALESIIDLRPLLKLNNLKSIDLNALYLDDLSQIEELSHIESLNIYDLNSEEGLIKLGDLSRLKSLGICDSNIKDYSQLRELNNLEQLGLTNNGIYDISFIENLTNLKGLDLSNNSIEDLNPISCLEELRGLKIDYNMVKSLSSLRKLYRIREYIYLTIIS